MIRIHVFCEGQTEESFIREVLYDHLREAGAYLNPILARTGPRGKGGIVRYAGIKRQLLRKCREDQSAYITTMFDLFRLPGDFPGQTDPRLPGIQDPLEKAAFLEQALQSDIEHRQFIPNLTVHEFEGLLYSEPRAFSEWFNASSVSQIETDRRAFPSPEHINDGPETAPSKRILHCCPAYEKPFHGSLIAIDIGIDRIRKECRHFDTWVRRLEDIAGGGR
jgi:hypothetical protein